MKAQVDKFNSDDVGCLNVIQTYLKEVTGTDPGTIIRPGSFLEIQLMMVAYEVAIKYYHAKGWIQQNKL